MEEGKVCQGLVGMLWFDNSKEPFEEKLRRAAQYYSKKFGKEAVVVEAPIHEVPLARLVSGLLAIPSKHTLPHHMILFHYDRNNPSQPDLDGSVESPSER